MSALLEDPKRLAFGEDEYSGATVKAGTWEPPAVIAAEHIATARAAVEEYTGRQAPPPIEVLLEWLRMLMHGIPHGMAEGPLQSRVLALAEAVEDYPAWVWTKDSRKLARARFGYVPAAKELIEFAEEITAGPRRDAAKLMRILDIGARRPERPAPVRAHVWSKELAEEALVRSRERARSDLEELGRIMRERDAQAAAEKPASTVAEQISRTAKAMKAMKPAPAEAAE